MVRLNRVILSFTKTFKKHHISKITMVRNLIPTCSKCGSFVSDHIEPEVEKEGQIKEGKYVDNVWVCNECLKNK